jgi:hypothetical protein
VDGTGDGSGGGVQVDVIIVRGLRCFYFDVVSWRGLMMVVSELLWK